MEQATRETVDLIRVHLDFIIGAFCEQRVKYQRIEAELEEKLNKCQTDKHEIALKYYDLVNKFKDLDRKFTEIFGENYAKNVDAVDEDQKKNVQDDCSSRKFTFKRKVRSEFSEEKCEKHLVVELAWLDLEIPRDFSGIVTFRQKTPEKDDEVYEDSTSPEFPRRPIILLPSAYVATSTPIEGPKKSAKELFSLDVIPETPEHEMSRSPAAVCGGTASEHGSKSDRSSTVGRPCGSKPLAEKFTYVQYHPGGQSRLLLVGKGKTTEEEVKRMKPVKKPEELEQVQLKQGKSSSAGKNRKRPASVIKDATEEETQEKVSSGKHRKRRESVIVDAAPPPSTASEVEMNTNEVAEQEVSVFDLSLASFEEYCPPKKVTKTEGYLSQLRRKLLTSRKSPSGKASRRNSSSSSSSAMQ